MKKSLLSAALIGGLAVSSIGAHQAQAASGTSIVQAAERGLGSAYSWGQNDCSGFTQQVFAQFGVQLPHNSAAQAGYGTKVDRAHLQPGDLVFFHTSGNGISHVGIYVGNNRMISAETEKTGVRETQIFDGGASTYWEPRFVTARRIISGNKKNVKQTVNVQQKQTASSVQASEKATTSAEKTSMAQASADGSTQSNAVSKVASSDQQKGTGTDQSSANVTDSSSASSEASASNANDPKHISASRASKTSNLETGKVHSGVYYVRAGDTLWEISNQNGVSVQKIQQINKLKNTLIRPGQKLYLNDPSAVYTIKSGDSLWAIARNHGTTVQSLMKLNHLSSDLIFPNEKLTIR
ncbi:LysM peptidoglycan-binding domain-containing protein [Sporolactobacillus sp. CPB3-1]|uniref:LysM peptidoglycan-binding domain-containing protein n=1 Tax=Sporolactobacillus mangiferae TaxID=2940498 RepID=A0ABT0M9S8_9BACL|nr:LysM peptidoglycan-binding domain-containing protein [Sporolactobacillus mangiferae]MCL1631637.1 LysM peptidoglycan-binding domain-containing protein [Sporolactobacillus mangiferae]